MGFDERWLAEVTGKPGGPKLARNHLSAKAAKPRGANGLGGAAKAPSTQVEWAVNTFVVPGVPVPKPRQTRSDKWKKRPSVLKYRGWADRAREIVGIRLFSHLSVVAYFPIPKQHSQAVRGLMLNEPHKSKPDADNVLKAVSDALCAEDQGIHEMSIKKRYDDGKGPRVEITIS